MNIGFAGQTSGQDYVLNFKCAYEIPARLCHSGGASLSSHP